MLVGSIDEIEYAQPEPGAPDAALRIKIRHHDADGRPYELTARARAIVFNGIPTDPVHNSNGSIVIPIHRAEVAVFFENDVLLVAPRAFCLPMGWRAAVAAD